MPALPSFAGLADPAVLLARLEEQRAELEARKAAFEARIATLERGVQPVGGLNLDAVAPGDVHVYSALAAAGWTAATRKGGVTLASPNLDSGGYVAWARLPGTQRYAVLQPNDLAAGVAANSPRWRVTVVDVAADGSTVIVATATFAGENAYSSFGSGNTYQACGVRWSGATTIKVQTESGYPSTSALIYPEQYGRRGFTTLTLDAGAGALSVVEDGWYAAPPRQQNGQIAQGSRHMRRSYDVGSFGLATPACFTVSGNIFGPGFLLSERAGFGGWVPAHVGSFSAMGAYATARLDDQFFAMLTDGRSPGNTAFTARLSLVRINDLGAGQVSAKATPQALAGNPRVFSLSASLLVGGWTTAGQYSSYVFTRDPTTNVVDGAGVAVATGEQGQVPFDVQAFSATKGLALRVSTGRTMRGQMFSVDPTVAAPGNPFTNGAAFTFDLTTAVAGSAAGDTVIVGAVERAGPDRIIVLARNVTRNALTFEVFDLT